MRAAIVLIALTATSPALARGSSPPAESAASDTLVVNGSFERGPGGTPLVILSAGSTAIPGWTVGRNDIDYITTYWQASNGSRSIDLSGFGPGSLVQELQGLAVGRKYRVIFDMAGNPDDGSPIKVLRVVINRQVHDFQFDARGSTRRNMRWTRKGFTFVYRGGASFLRFISLENSPYGPALDNVRVFRVQ